MAHIVGIVLEELACEKESVISYLPAFGTRHLYACVSISTAILFSREKKSRVTNYVETVLPLYSLDDFKDRFRLSRTTFETFVTDMSPHMVTSTGQTIGVEKKLLVYIKFVSTQFTFQALADMFGICETTVHTIVHEVSELVCTNLLPNLIRWPVGHKVRETVNGFQELTGFPGVIGTIDGSHIPIRVPSEGGENYINRKKYASVVLQAVCDSTLCFTDVYCGWPGSVHDARVLKNSPLHDKANDEEQMFPNKTHLLGDAAYPLTTWMMTPFKDFGNLTRPQRAYNYKHSSTRMCIERAFGALKGRFRRLKHVDLADLKGIVHVILSCCALHQLCLENSEEMLVYIEEGVVENAEVNNFENLLQRSPNGDAKRKEIVNLLK